jgi:Mannosylglycerate hydrolase MGH1-like glycoside hydrolase domain
MFGQMNQKHEARPFAFVSRTHFRPSKGRLDRSSLQTINQNVTQRAASSMRAPLLYPYLLAVALLIFSAPQAQGRREIVATPPNCPEFPTQNTSTPAAIVNQAFYFLECHRMVGTKFGKPFHFFRPSLEKYGPDQWLWDSCSHQIALSWRKNGGTDDATAALRTLFSMQKPDGRVPEEIFWGDNGAMGNILAYLEWSSPESADITQMPLPPFSLRAIFNRTRDVRLLKEFVPKIVKYYDWWASTRAPDGDDLVYIIHGWESGLDASPTYDQAYGVKDPKPEFLSLYSKFIELVIDYAYRYDWNQTAIVYRKEAPFEIIDGYFLVKDVGVNSVYAAGWGVLAELADRMKDTALAARCRAMQSKVEASIIKHMWNAELSRFVSLYRDRDGVQREATVEAVQSLFPLLLSSLPRPMADSIVKTQLTNTSRFWLTYPIPSVSAASPEFTPDFTVDLMWYAFFIMSLLFQTRFSLVTCVFPPCMQERPDVAHFELDRDGGTLDSRLWRRSRRIVGSVDRPVPKSGHLGAVQPHHRKELRCSWTRDVHPHC